MRRTHYVGCALWRLSGYVWKLVQTKKLRRCLIQRHRIEPSCGVESGNIGGIHEVESGLAALPDG